jgi:aspartyl protease family protein
LHEFSQIRGNSCNSCQTRSEAAPRWRSSLSFNPQPKDYSTGLTTLTVEVGNPSAPEATEKVDLLVDSGAIYSVVPQPVLERLGIKPLATEEYRLADGSKITRKKGGALFRYGGRVGVADVIFGEPGDSQLLGALTLEALGLSLDPVRRELKPLPLILAISSGVGI